MFSVTGTTFGAGNGTTTFNIPNLMDRFVVGAGSGYARNATGGTNTHNHTGNTDGTAITVNQMPAHGHSMDGQGSHQHYVSNGDITGGGIGNDLPTGSNYIAQRWISSGNDNYRYQLKATGSGPDRGLTNTAGGHTHTIYNNGGGQSHTHPIQSANNLPPYIALGYIIRYAWF